MSTDNCSKNNRESLSSRSKPTTRLSGEKTLTKKYILVADDDPSVRESLCNLLAGEGYFVMAAKNGQVALNLIDRSSIDLVLLDLNMPIKNGWDTYEQITTNHPFIPIIIITGRPNQLFTSVSAGVGALLEKPIEIPTLLQTIKKLLTEPFEQRLIRLLGENTEFIYKPTATNRVKR